jgi:tRNA(fMet)-specific endonuclease VapC
VTLFMLDTNTISYLIHKRSIGVQERMDALSPEDRICISVITEAELRYGVALKPEATKLARSVELIVSNLQILPWTSEAARAYALLRAENRSLGLAAGDFDLLITAHALAARAVLVTNDAAILKLQGNMSTANWATDMRPN